MKNDEKVNMEMILSLSSGVVCFCPACSLLEIWDFKPTLSVNFIDELRRIFLSFVSRCLSYFLASGL